MSPYEQTPTRHKTSRWHLTDVLVPDVVPAKVAPANIADASVAQGIGGAGRVPAGHALHSHNGLAAGGAAGVQGDQAESVDGEAQGAQLASPDGACPGVALLPGVEQGGWGAPERSQQPPSLDKGSFDSQLRWFLFPPSLLHRPVMAWRLTGSTPSRCQA